VKKPTKQTKDTDQTGKITNKSVSSKTEKKPQGTQSLDTTAFQKKATQTAQSPSPIKDSPSHTKANSDKTQKPQDQIILDCASRNQNLETTQTNTAQTFTGATGSTRDHEKSVSAETSVQETSQTEEVSATSVKTASKLPEEAAKHSEPEPEPEPEPYQYVHPPLENKYLNKEALRNRLLLRQEFKPLIAYIGRLDFQKGVHLIRHGIFYALQNSAQFVLLGISPDPRINDEFWQLKHHLNENPDCHLELGFNEELSHLIYAGADMIIMPSLYEPCGLAQMIALKYGTVPIVRAVGGLVDTVFDRDYSDRPTHERNGYVFHEPDATGLESAMSRAIGLWYDYPEEFRQLVINGMKYDFSWNFPGQHYVNIYEYIRYK
jgi:glycosyltransferase involved in cell wall biosynthesis